MKLGLLFVRLNLVDALLTLLAVERGFREFNPLWAAVLPLGAVWFVLAKVLASTLLWWCCDRFKLDAVLRASIFGMALVVLWNIAMLLR